MNMQYDVDDWIRKTFGSESANDPVERNHRFLEEALELAQACGCTKEDAIALVDYVFSRPVGEVQQEVGGVMVTLLALCNVQKVDTITAYERELERCWDNIDKIREKQKAKPKNSPLPQ